ncbi:MAG: rRNA maturation RNase YbeY [Limisphaerales bacterium]
MNIFISNRQRARKTDLRLLTEIAASLLTELKIEEAELEINLVGAVEMAALNEKFLQHKGSTDVITFDYRLSVGRDSRRAAKNEKRLARTLAPPYLSGEIFISVDDAMQQSKKFKTKWQSEIVRYIVHGILHLLGYDDLRADLRRKMKREENRLLRKLSRRFALSKL